MQQARGVNYKEYSQKLEKRLEVEKQREQDYKESRRMVAEVDRQIHR
ncbi:hypothetical protein EDC24_2784 [Aquisalibacillus elongatus]|uniref:Uncharacterized protein n=2 Tax=Aquisalibacillus elongatus TaxID=485577 RepID=A0A3N5AZH9_9BACI|nr:hypothetical protein EDC24_2784 [Aquisalibacillus elongatus]